MSFNIGHYQFDETCVGWAHYIKHILWDCVRNERVTSLVFEDKIGFQEEFQLRAALSHILKNLSNNLLAYSSNFFIMSIQAYTNH